jgi:DNA-binding XRE family transcriptional regulator
MARTPANITQADIARAIRAAKQTGAAEVEVRVGTKSTIVIRILPSTGTWTPDLEQTGEIVL